MNFDECIFCERELEQHRFSYTEENGERAINSTEEYGQLKICRKCAKRLQGIINSNQDVNIGTDEPEAAA